LFLAGAAVGVVVVPLVLVPVVVPVSVPDVVVWAGVDVAGAAALPPVSSPALVTKNVIARTRTPNAAMIAGRGSSIREAVGTVWVKRSFANCVFGTLARMP
jgi:hypothetical protein